MTITEKIVLAIVLLSMTSVIVVIVRKFPVLSVLNTDNIPGEKEASFKRSIIKKRVDRDLAKIGGSLQRLGDNAKILVKKSLFFLERNLNVQKISYIKKSLISVDKKEEIIKELFKEAELAEKEEDEFVAEAKYLEIINLDQKNTRAFFYLGELYYKVSKYTESIQTLNHALKLAMKEKSNKELDEDLSVAEIYFALAKSGREIDRIDYSIDCLVEALDIEPNNPRYLDLILDLSIIKKDKGLAWTYYNKMSKINPENNKLNSWYAEIIALGEKKE